MTDWNVPATDPDVLRLWDQLLEVEPRATLCWLATRDAEFGANVSPKEIFALNAPGQMLIAEIASGRTLGNLRQDPRVCVSLVDTFHQRGGFKIWGQARIIPRDAAAFPTTVLPLAALVGELGTIRHIIAVTIHQIQPVPAPNHRAPG